MGNKIARTTQASATEYYLHDLPSSYNLVLKEVLGRDRFLKSILCKHDEGLVLVKVYFKRGDSIDLRDYERRLAGIRDILAGLDHPHVWPFQFWLETDKAAYLLRQYFFNNLHDRLSTRPFLSLVEKTWLAFQLLYAAKQSHERGVCHGDIKLENVLVTSWNWLYLADFASFKPTYIPYDDPSDFSFFFDTGGRRRCYVAPERFYEHGGETQVAQDALLKPSMDIFSAGCVIAELFLEGQPLFELSQLLAYRRGQYDPSQHLEKIPDSGIRKMVLHMIQLDPDSRCSAESYLQSYAGVVFPSYFSPFLHKFYSLLNPLSSDARVIACETSFQEILRQMMGHTAGDGMISGQGSSDDDRSQLPSTTNSKLDSSRADNYFGEREETKNKSSPDKFDLLGNVNTLLKDVEQNSGHFVVKSVPNNVVETVYNQNQNQSGLQATGELIQSVANIFHRSCHPFLKKIAMADLSSLISDYNNESDTSGMPLIPVPQDILSCEGMVLIASLLCSCIRNVKVPFIRRGAVLLLKSCSLYIDDEDRLQRILPYVIAVLSDPSAIVRCAALETLCDILPLVRDFPPSDAKIFPEYILPMLSMLPDDSEESVRICYASNISKLALTAYGFIIHSISLTEAGVLNETNLSCKSLTPATDTHGEPLRVNNDAQLAQLRKSIAEVIQELVMGPKQTPNIRRALLHDIGNLCWFFGQKQSNDFLLPVLPAFLNDRDEQLRAVFYGQIMYVCFFVGQRSVEEYLLPYIEQALNDITESVIVNALDCLAVLCRSGFLRKRVLLEMIERAFPLLCYPSKWVRRSSVTFIAATSETLGAIDSYVFLVPVIRPLLRRQPASLASEKALLGCLKPPISRELYQQIIENAESSDMLERQRKFWYNTSSQSKQLDAVDLLQQTARELDPKLWSDRQNDIQLPSFTGVTGECMDSGNYHDNAGKLKTMGGLTHGTINQDEAQDHVASEKSQLSGFMSPQMSCMNSFIEKSSESIPLYYFKVDNRWTTGTVPPASDSSYSHNSFGFGTSSMPIIDPVNKSFTLAGSVSAPKLVSGSVYVGNGPAVLRRVVHEEDGETEESPYISSKLHEMRVSDRGTSLKLDNHTPSAELTEASSLVRTSTIHDSAWRPRGVLVAHLQEHKSAVRDISISMDHHFFVSASEDSTVKIWDCKKLEKDISFRSRLTYSLGGSRAMCAAVLQGSTQIVVGASDGMMHKFSVERISRGLGNVVENYSGIADVKKISLEEGAILSLLNYSADGSTSKIVLCSTQNCGIHLWDTRTSSNGWNTKVFPEKGYVSSLVADPCGNWFVSGSSRGVLTLWDLRFCIPVNSWQYSHACPIEKMCLFAPPTGTPLSTATRPLVYVAAGCNEVSLWNAENGSCHQVLRAANHESDAENCEAPWALARSSGKANAKSVPRRGINSKYRIDELNEPSPCIPGIRALLPLPGGDLLTGGTDLKIRRWDHCSPERSYCVCGPSIKGVNNDDLYETKSSFGVQVVQEGRRRPLATRLTGKAILAAAATDSAGGCHRDSVLSLASVKLNQRLLISSSRDGAIKVWK